ncbi:INSYN2B protein-like [Grus japonensis]|uniref:INSYN2B protein-like n=1 Tax=Grus japonensis TaxID=30415 RepID=A0ABC9WQX8_GRUJA
MVSREPLPGPAPAGEGGQEKAMTVRSVLLNRDSPDIESRLKRRRNRTQQVRFKDLLVVAAKGPVGPPVGDEDTRTSQGEGPRGPGEQGDLQSQLQSLEGVLETSQQTIRVLLDVIQDLEKKEAQRDGRHSYRTGQDIANCGTCRDCACIIYSVEHDFRQQEGRFQRVLSHIEGDATPSSPVAVAGAVLSPRQEPSPATKLPAKLDAKKSRRKCFWFL